MNPGLVDALRRTECHNGVLVTQRLHALRCCGCGGECWWRNHWRLLQILISSYSKKLSNLSKYEVYSDESAQWVFIIKNSWLCKQKQVCGVLITNCGRYTHTYVTDIRCINQSGVQRKIVKCRLSIDHIINQTTFNTPHTHPLPRDDRWQRSDAWSTSFQASLPMHFGMTIKLQKLNNYLIAVVCAQIFTNTLQPTRPS